MEFGKLGVFGVQLGPMPCRYSYARMTGRLEAA